MWKLLPLISFALVSVLGTVLAGQDKAVDEAARIAAVTQPTDDFSRSEPYELRPGGAATSFETVNRDAFSHASANMSFERELDFKVGNGIFRKIWVSAPASTASSDGLGPLFNARACQSCHLKDGRGHPPATSEDAGGSMLLRLSVPPQDDAQREALASLRQSVIPEPTYGTQLQDLSIQGHLAEGRLRIEYEEIPVELADGTVVHLRNPTYRVTDLNYGPMNPEVMLSARIAPPMIGLGLLEMIDESDILAGADPDDANGDGISGKPNRVWSEAHGEVRLGRFGWKAGEPTIRQQTAHAFAGDIGLSSDLTPTPAGDCTDRQPDCLAAPNGVDPQYGDLEVAPEMMDLVVFYSRNLAVPARRDLDDPDILAGKRLFYESGCITCHRPKYVTRRDEAHPEQSFQLIWPYTDLLLHDMGEGLADGRPDGNATGREWRTPPLWGIGLTEVVNGHTLFLHDGRARNLLEAILWHGGEAEAARKRIVEMTEAQRDALIAFLNSL
ncbi:di-heme oxidoredictase family protein [Rhodospirillaceae bacterium SYSU D60014]|uniref:di-heme oxidoreductase family protein n=1 Tax=Virgifigura deserti TaxID=2268457 RepID=UPI000E6717B6